MTSLKLCDEVTVFLHAHGRLPRVDDQPPPWHYRGWLLPYVFHLHRVIPAVADRWGYHLRTLEAGKLLEEPIPQVAFGSPDPTVLPLIHAWCRPIGRDGGGWSDFGVLVDWLSWALALSRAQPRLSDAVNEQLYRKVNLGPLLERPYDYWGELVSQGRAKGWNPTAFFPTPHNVVELMTRITMADNCADDRDPRTCSVNDPAVGTGRMLLHASNISLNLWGQDIDPLVVALCKINGALYAPWLSFPLPPAILGRQVAVPHASSPVSEPSAEEVPLYRVDDFGQGLLFPL